MDQGLTRRSLLRYGGGGAAPLALTGSSFARALAKPQNSQRGYVRHTLAAGEWRADYRVVDYVSRPGAPISTKASFVIQVGTPGLQPA